MSNKEIKTNLKSGKVSVLVDTLKHISARGNKEILVDIIGLLHSNTDNTVRNEIINILENLKLQNCSPIIIKAIENKKYNKELFTLVSSCWKNSLNFEEYIEVFTDVFINTDFLLAFEALTVIDTFDKVDHKKADLCIVRLESSIEDAKEDKRPLYFELMNIIKNIKENPVD